jgi:hypothetical protein
VQRKAVFIVIIALEYSKTCGSLTVTSYFIFVKDHAERGISFIWEPTAATSSTLLKELGRDLIAANDLGSQSTA